MYIMITDIVGEKRIDLAYSIWGREVAVVGVFSNNIRYEFTKPWTIELESGNMQIMARTYMRRELTDLVERRIQLTLFDKHPRINRMNKLAGITEMVFSLDKLNNTDNLEDRSLSNVLLRYHVTGSHKSLSNVLLRYHVTASHELMHLEPVMPQYKQLRNGKFCFPNPVSNGLKPYNW